MLDKDACAYFRSMPAGRRRFLLPNQGRLFHFCSGLLPSLKATVPLNERALQCRIGCPEGEIMFVRSEDIPDLIEQGVGSVGVTGLDYVVESGAAITVLDELDLCRGHVSLQVPDFSEISSIRALPPNARVVTQYPRIGRTAVARAGRSDVRLILICGAAEAYVSAGLADASIDVVSTGETAKANQMKVVETLVRTAAVLVGSREHAEPHFSDTVLKAIRVHCRGLVNTGHGQKHADVLIPGRSDEVLLPANTCNEHVQSI